MSTRRNKTNDAPTLADLENASNPIETPGIMPPPGVKARVRTTVDYDRFVDPLDNAPDYPDDLRELASQEIDDNEIPPPTPSDPFSDFLETYHRFIGYPLKIVRLPDPATRRTPGNTYNRPCFELEILSDTPFDPNNLTGMLQIINGNSGGVFRIWLCDESGQRIPGAQLDRLVVADPPKQYTQRQRLDTDDYEDRRDYYRRRQVEHTEPAPAPEKSENEKFMEQLQRDLFEKTVMRALDPTPPPTPDPLSALSPDDRLALGLLQRGDILESAVNRIANLAQAPDRLESSTWKDKVAEAAINVVTQNPQVIATATDIISRTVAMIAQAFAPRQAAQIVSEPIPVQPIVHRPPAQRAAPQVTPYQPAPPPQQAVNTGLPEVPNPDDDDLEDDEIDMIDNVTKLLLSDKPLSFDDPIVLDLREAYKERFDAVLRSIGVMPSMMIIQYVCSKSDFAADMFMSERYGAHLKLRLEELKALIRNSDLLPPEIKEQLAQETPTEQG